MPSATVKPAEVFYLPLNDPADWGMALAKAIEVGYRGKIEAYTDAAGADFWGIELNGSGNPMPVTGTRTDVLVWDGWHFESLTHANFIAKYEV